MSCKQAKRNRLFQAFQTKATQVHGGAYTYAEAKYINTSVKICIRCAKHGLFTQRPSSHLQGKGCPACGKTRRYTRRRKTRQQFIRNARAVHGRQYRYDHVVYKNTDSKVSISCFKHGTFMQTPSSHLRGRGCPNCASIKRLHARRKSDKTFIKEATMLHNGRYIYSHVQYVNTDTKVHIKCKVHGCFKQTPSAHLQGRGCPQCCNKGTSRAEQEYMAYISVEHPELQHFNNKGQFRIPGTKYIADGYTPVTNTIYEFDGDFWHGNPKLYDSNALNKVNKKTFGALLRATRKKRSVCEELGYKYISIWHSEWKQFKRAVIKLQKLYRKRYR